MTTYEKFKSSKSFRIVDLLDIKNNETSEPAFTIIERSDNAQSSQNTNNNTRYYSDSNENFENEAYFIDSNNESSSYTEMSTNNSRSSRKSESRSQSRSRSCSRSSNSSGYNLKKNRKSRTAFSDYQLNSLEKSFEKHKYLSVQDRYFIILKRKYQILLMILFLFIFFLNRIELAAKLNLTDTQVKTWYQNRRYISHIIEKYVILIGYSLIISEEQNGNDRALLELNG
jgi:hypothetical protein